MPMQTPSLQILGGGGCNIHTGLLVDTSVYANVVATAYTRPVEPVPYAQHGAGNTAAARADANGIHKEERRVYDIDENVDTSLKQDFIATVEETYLSAKNRSTWGYTASLTRAACITSWRGMGKSERQISSVRSQGVQAGPGGTY